MNTKTVELIAKPPAAHFVGDGFRVHNFIPSNPKMNMQRMNPFLMLDYNSTYHFPPSDKPKGVGVHPHKGFETVTIAYKGRVAHHDSSGGGGTIGEGDIQWMTAANGVLHKEYHEEEWSKQGGDFQMVQLWVNLPAKDKKLPAKYQAIKNEDLKRYQLPDDKGIIEVIAGKYKDVEGAAFTFTPVHLFNAKLKAGAEAEFQIPANFNTALLVLEGSITINDKENVPTDNLALMANDGEYFSVKTDEDALVLILSGEPIEEPIAAQGPFVMNSREELYEAFEDFQNGKFGTLS